MNRKKIIYIIGAGRSGTTLLDVALGNAGNVFSCGELNRYPVREGIPTGFQNAPERLAFWSHFTENFQKNHDLKKQAILHDEFEYHKGLVKRLLGSSRKAKYEEYQQFLRDFYTKLFDSIEESVVVDSSKYPGRALGISDALPYEIDYIYIKRDPVSVVESFAKTDVYLPPKGWLQANVYYFLVNTLCKIVIGKLKRKHKVLEIKYEDFIESPEKVMEVIQQKLKIDLTTAIKKIKNDEYLKVGELFEGNSMRIDPQIKLKRSKQKAHRKNLRNSVTRLLNYSIYN
ncbi:MAG: sulfotransferase [Bacteroidia bacterium]|nr:sulfotransferase [Bacteroidia bacterium]